MNKIIILAVGVVIVAGGAAFVVSNQNNKDDKTNGSLATNSTTERTKGIVACDLITLEDAKNLIGANATASEATDAVLRASTEGVSVDNCTYSSDAEKIGDFKQITVQRHYGDASLVKRAYENYKKEFPGEPVANLGDEAYYATEAKQIQVLKGDYWLYLAGGSINAGDAANKELELKAAQLALEKL